MKREKPQTKFVYEYGLECYEHIDIESYKARLTVKIDGQWVKVFEFSFDKYYSMDKIIDRLDEKAEARYDFLDA